MVRQVPLLAACALLTIGNARAQTFTGTYTLPNQTGVVTLTLKQDAQGKGISKETVSASFSPRWGPTTSRAMTRCAS